MDWSATLSLTTSRARQHKANYGSFARTSSASKIRIPQSIPENQCVLQFASPRCRVADLADFAVDTQSHNGGGSGGGGTMTLTATATATATAREQRTFKMLLTRPTVTTALLGDVNNRIEPLNNASSDTVSSYWIQERERRRLQRNGSPTKGSPTSSDRDDAPSSVWRTVFIMCSVPLALVVLFFLVLLVFGDGSDAARALSMPNLFRKTPSLATARLRSAAAHFS